MLPLIRWYRGIRYLHHIARRRGSGKEARPRHLLVDVSVLRRSDSRTGVQRVVRAMLAELAKMTLKDIAVQPVYATRKEFYRYCDLAFLNEDLPMQVPRVDGVVDPRAGDVFLGLDLAIHLLPIHERQIIDWKERGVSIFIIVYDLLPLRDRRWFTTKLRRRFRSWLKLLARRADGAICISHAVAEELEQVLTGLGARTGRPRVSTIPLGGDIMATLPSSGLPAEAETLLKEIKSRPTILMVGTIEPRKAYDKALAAFERLWSCQGDAAPRLLIVGKAGWKTRSFQRLLRSHPESGRAFRWLDDVSDEFLDRLYDAATGVLMTSYAEGCGLPALEALDHRKQVLVRDLAVFREMGSQHFSFFGDDDPDALAGVINDFVRSAQQAAGRSMTDVRMSWSKSALSLMNVVEGALVDA